VWKIQTIITTSVDVWAHVEVKSAATKVNTACEHLQEVLLLGRQGLGRQSLLLLRGLAHPLQSYGKGYNNEKNSFELQKGSK